MEKNPVEQSLACLFTIFIICVGSVYPSLYRAEVKAPVISDFSRIPDRIWIGPDYWANRLEDWRVKAGRLECVVDDPVHAVRTVHMITHEVINGPNSFTLGVDTGISARNNGEGWTGFLIGAGAGRLDYRAAALIHCSSGLGGGIVAILNTASDRLEIRNMGADSAGDEYPILAQSRGAPVFLDEQGLHLRLHVTHREGAGYDLLFIAESSDNNKELGRVLLKAREETEILGSLALVANPVGQEGELGSTFWFKKIRAGGPKIQLRPERIFGPLAATLYTTADGILKMTAQFMPLGRDTLITSPRHIVTHQATLEYRPSKGEQTPWKEAQTARIRAVDRGAHFRVEPWDDSQDWEYRILLRGWEGPVGSGLIRADPVDKKIVSCAAFTGMGVMGLTAYARDARSGTDPYAGRWTPANLWFPNAELIRSVKAQEPDILFFTGDQIYEIKPTPRPYTDRFPILDYLYKWYLWCWSFGELTQEIPCTCQLDDHDVYQGNVWGWSGRLNMTGVNSSGGYELDPLCVNAIASTQCSHMPDPYDPVPTGEGLINYYTGFTYGGISFAILEDRKFKVPNGALGPPEEIGLTPEGRPDYSKIDWSKYENLSLLGQKQEEFLEAWGKEGNGTQMKVVVSQTIYASAHTDRGGRGEISLDMDSNGFPKPGRDRAVDLFRRAGALVISGDQHLGTVMRLGIDKPGDAVFQFCVPAVGNIFWRYFYPAQPGANLDFGAPEYTGDFKDGFGNHFRMIAAANPQDLDVYKAGIPRGLDFPTKPEGLRNGDRYCQGDGYGIVRFDKKARTARLECWPYFRMPPSDGSGRGQFYGWPLEIHLESQDKRLP